MIAVMVAIAAQAVHAAFADPLGSKNPDWLTVINFVSAVCGIVGAFCSSLRLSWCPRP